MRQRRGGRGGTPRVGQHSAVQAAEPCRIGRWGAAHAKHVGTERRDVTGAVTRGGWGDAMKHAAAARPFPHYIANNRNLAEAEWWVALHHGQARRGNMLPLS